MIPATCCSSESSVTSVISPSLIPLYTLDSCLHFGFLVSKIETECFMEHHFSQASYLVSKKWMPTMHATLIYHASQIGMKHNRTRRSPALVIDNIHISYNLDHFTDSIRVALLALYSLICSTADRITGYDLQAIAAAVPDFTLCVPSGDRHNL